MSHRKDWRKVLWASPLVLCAGFLLLAADIYFYSKKVAFESADAAVVLGTEIWHDQPSPVFRERINHAVDLYQRRVVQRIIFTGGRTEDQALSEAEVARAYATARGVSTQDIYVESVSRTTYENLTEAKRIADTEGIDTILIVSDPLHMRRAMTMAQDLGLQAEPSPTPSSRYQSARSQIRFLVREVALYATYLMERVLR